MEIGINLDNYTDPMVDLENFICDYGNDSNPVKVIPNKIKRVPFDTENFTGFWYKSQFDITIFGKRSEKSS